MNLRFIVRDGKKILQKNHVSQPTPKYDEYWQDVPCVEEPEKSALVTRSQVLKAFDNSEDCMSHAEAVEHILKELGL